MLLKYNFGTLIEHYWDACGGPCGTIYLQLSPWEGGGDCSHPLVPALVLQYVLHESNKKIRFA